MSSSSRFVPAFSSCISANAHSHRLSLHTELTNSTLESVVGFLFLIQSHVICAMATSLLQSGTKSSTIKWFRKIGAFDVIQVKTLPLRNRNSLSLARASGDLCRFRTSGSFVDSPLARHSAKYAASFLLMLPYVFSMLTLCRVARRGSKSRIDFSWTFRAEMSSSRFASRSCTFLVFIEYGTLMKTISIFEKKSLSACARALGPQR